MRHRRGWTGGRGSVVETEEKNDGKGTDGILLKYVKTVIKIEKFSLSHLSFKNLKVSPVQNENETRTKKNGKKRKNENEETPERPLGETGSTEEEREECKNGKGELKLSGRDSQVSSLRKFYFSPILPHS